MPLNTSGPISLAGSVTGQSIAVQLGLGTTSTISLNDAAVRSLAGIASGTISMPTNFWGKGITNTIRGIFGYGSSGSYLNVTNLVSTTGVVAADTTGVGTARNQLAACSYGTDKGIFGYGTTGTVSSLTNLVSNTGVVASNTAGVGAARLGLAACGYGGNKGLFGYGAFFFSPFYFTSTGVTNLISSTGVVSTDTSGVGTVRYALAAATYGGDKGIFGYGNNRSAGSGVNFSLTNLVSNTGVVATDTAGVGTARRYLAACGYGGDKVIFGYGAYEVGGSTVYASMTNLVSNTGVVASDTTGVGTARSNLAACIYGGDKGIFGYGGAASASAVTNLVSNTGVVSTDTAGVGTARFSLAACGYST